jgi:hypothetical protein
MESCCHFARLYPLALGSRPNRHSAPRTRAPATGDAMIVTGLRAAEPRRVRTGTHRQIDPGFRWGLSLSIHDFLPVCTWTDVTRWRTTRLPHLGHFGFSCWSYSRSVCPTVNGFLHFSHSNSYVGTWRSPPQSKTCSPRNPQVTACSLPLLGPVTRPTPVTWTSYRISPVGWAWNPIRLGILAKARVVRLDHLWTCGSGDFGPRWSAGQNLLRDATRPCRGLRGALRTMGRS